ncbi:Uncharacterized protein Rs2_06412 [Raphanus sativus]|nr:Uncharacterized protein Rs2_06412 [Raphanus sativus]
MSQAKVTVSNPVSSSIPLCDLRRCISSSSSGGSMDLLQSEAFVPQFLYQPSDYFNSWQDPPEQKPFLNWSFAPQGWKRKRVKCFCVCCDVHFSKHSPTIRLAEIEELGFRDISSTEE